MLGPIFVTIIKTSNDGTSYRVEDVQFLNIKDGVANTYLTCGDNLSISLKRNLIAGKTITIPINIVTTKGQGNLTIDDFKIETPSDLDEYKNKKNQQLQNIFSFHLANFGGMALFNLVNSFSILASNGYFITEANREQKYLDIINTGNKDLISALEDYLNHLDQVTPVAAMYKDLQQAQIDIVSATTTAEVDKAYQLFDTAS